MTSRERVLCALNHRQPDRVPIDFGGTSVSGIAASTYHRLKQFLGISSQTQVIDLYQILAEVERPVLERFGADVVSLRRTSLWRRSRPATIGSRGNCRTGRPSMYRRASTRSGTPTATGSWSKTGFPSPACRKTVSTST